MPPTANALGIASFCPWNTVTKTTAGSTRYRSAHASASARLVALARTMAALAMSASQAGSFTSAMRRGSALHNHGKKSTGNCDKSSAASEIDPNGQSAAGGTCAK